MNKLCIKSFSNYKIESSPLDELLDPEETFYAKKLIVKKTDKLKALPEFTPKLPFGSIATDHLLEIDWSEENGWENPIISPYRKFDIDPFNTTLHYAVQCFEGMKAFLDDQNRIRLFRPALNMNRFRRSCLRISLPDFSGNEFLKCIKEFLKVEKRWIPNKYGYSMYLRPTAISMTDVLGVRPPNKAKVFVCASPVGPYYPTGFQPVSLYCEKGHVRAARKGYGNFKLGSNYGPTISVSKTAELKGYAQILWLYNNLITEVGTSNFFVFWKNEDGVDELATHPADELILPGVTRDAVLRITRSWKKFKVSERFISIFDVIEALNENRVYEIFTSGTAVTIGPVKSFYFDYKDYKVPYIKEMGSGKLTKEVSDAIMDIQYGKVEHPFSMIVDE